MKYTELFNFVRLQFESYFLRSIQNNVHGI